VRQPQPGMALSHGAPQWRVPITIGRSFNYTLPALIYLAVGHGAAAWLRRL